MICRPIGLSATQADMMYAVRILRSVGIGNSAEPNPLSCHHLFISESYILSPSGTPSYSQLNNRFKILPVIPVVGTDHCHNFIQLRPVSTVLEAVRHIYSIHYTPYITMQLRIVHLLIFIVLRSSTTGSTVRAAPPPIGQMCPTWHPGVLCPRFKFCRDPWQPEDSKDQRFVCLKGNVTSRVTMVTSLYDIQRQGRPIAEYVTWLRKTININANIILYTKQGG